MKMTAKNLVRTMYLQAEEHNYSNTMKIAYFIDGFRVALSEGMDQVEYWRSASIAYPDLVDYFYNILVNNYNVNENVKSFLKKMTLLK